MGEEGISGSGTPKLCAVVVTHERLAQLKITLAALVAVPPSALEAILVVDNASSDGTAAFLASEPDPRLRLLRLPQNLGGAGGFAAGMREAVESIGADWIVVMDDDARPHAGAIERFRSAEAAGAFADHAGIAAAVRHPDGSICEMNRPVLNPFRHPRLLMRTLLGGGREAFHFSEADFAGDALREIDGASFVGLFLRGSAMARHGYPNPRLFIYGDDAIYTQALTAQGERLGFAPQIRFEHDSSTYSRSDRRIRPLWKVYYYHRNLTILYRQAAGVFFWPVMLLYMPRWLMRLAAHRGERRAFLRLYLRALRDGFRGDLGRSHAEVLSLAGAPR